MNENYLIHFVGRKSGHDCQRVTIKEHKAILGTEIGVSNLVAYAGRGYGPEQVKTVTIYYSDGMMFGPVVVGVTELKGGLVFEHISHDGTTWMAICTLM